MRSNSLFDPNIPLLGTGMVSLVLGTIGLLLFFLPILSLPIAAFGLLFGIIGVFTAIFGPGNLRWSLGGFVLSSMALGVGLAIMLAPAGYLPSRSVPKIWNPIPKKNFVPPPAKQGNHIVGELSVQHHLAIGLPAMESGSSWMI